MAGCPLPSGCRVAKQAPDADPLQRMYDMADPVSPPTPGAWRADPQADFLTYQLLRLPCAAHSSHFADDPKEVAYNTSLRREQRRKRGKAWALRAWAENPERGALLLTAHPVANTFTLTVTGAHYTADVAVTYDIDLAELDSASVAQFRGDVARAAADAAFWVDELTEFGLDDLDLNETELEEKFDADADDPVDDPSDDTPESGDAPHKPPGDTPENRRRVERMARALSRHIRDDAGPELPERDQDWLEATPQSLESILGVTVDTAVAMPRDARLFDACVAILNHQLELVRYRSERLATNGRSNCLSGTRIA